MSAEQMEQDMAILLEDGAASVPRSWYNRKVLGVVGVVGLVCTAAAMPHGLAAIRAKPSSVMQKQAYGAAPGPYGAQQGYGAGVGHGPAGAPIAAHPGSFIPYAEAHGGAAPPLAVTLPAAAAPPAAGGAPPGPYGAQQGYGAHVAHGPVGAPIANHPNGFIPFAEAQAMAHGGAPPAAVPQPAPVAPAAAAGAAPGPYGAQQGYGAGVGHGPNGAPIAAHPGGFIAHADAPAQNGDKPLTLNIYYETKCPYSQGFIVDEVMPALSDPTCVFEHVHVRWEPYGNVQDAGGALVCQHGEGECFGNKLHICAKKAFKGNDEGLNNWITCHMNNVKQGTHVRDQAGYASCPGADAGMLTACANAPDTFELFRQVGHETLKVRAEHMPWAIVSLGQPNLQGRLVQGLCEEYGTGVLASYPKPACCSG